MNATATAKKVSASSISRKLTSAGFFNGKQYSGTNWDYSGTGETTTFPTYETYEVYKGVQVTSNAQHCAGNREYMQQLAELLRAEGYFVEINEVTATDSTWKRNAANDDYERILIEYTSDWLTVCAEDPALTAAKRDVENARAALARAEAKLAELTA
jgi:hypothetical protein